jgi:hypothetical protein
MHFFCFQFPHATGRNFLELSPTLANKVANKVANTANTANTET